MPVASVDWSTRGVDGEVRAVGPGCHFEVKRDGRIVFHRHLRRLLQQGTAGIVIDRLAGFNDQRIDSGLE